MPDGRERGAVEWSEEDRKSGAGSEDAKRREWWWDGVLMGESFTEDDFQKIPPPP